MDGDSPDIARAASSAAITRALGPYLARAAKGDGRLPAERELADMVGVSRRQLRLVLDDLARRGTVFRRRGLGTFVVPPPPPEKGRHRVLAGRLTLGQLMDVRRQIEPRLAELAALNAGPEEIEALRALMLRTTAPGAGDYDRADEIFHYRIAELAGNALFLEIHELIRQTRREAGWRARRAEVNRPAILRILAQQHRQIFDAIAAGDVTAAGRAQLAHMDYVAATLRMDDRAAGA